MYCELLDEEFITERPPINGEKRIFKEPDGTEILYEYDAYEMGWFAV